MKKVLLNNFSLIIFILILSLSFYAHYNLRYYLRFGDEVGHLYSGHLILNNKILYKDIQLNHQPIPYIYSAIIEKITQPENLYKYIGYQRMSIFIYSLFWNIIYFIYFGKISLVFIFLFEFLKLFYLGFQNLGETFAVYTLIFLIGSIYKNYIDKKTNYLDIILYSFANFLAFFSLAPLWPSLFFLFIFKFILLKTKKEKIILIITSVFLISILSFFIPYSDYLRETIYNNYKYFLPSFKHNLNIFQYLFFPFQPFLPPYDLISIIIGLFTIIFIINLFITSKKNKKIFKILIFFIFIIYLLNTRDPIIKFDKFPKFHMIPWIGAYLIINILTLKYLVKNKIKIAKIFIFSILFITCYLILFKNGDYYKKRDFMNDFYINYSESEKYGRIINALKNNQDRLLVIPNDPLIYYLTNIKPPIRINEYYGWTQKIPEDNKKLINLFKNSPPEFVVNIGNTNGLDKNNFLEKYVLDNLEKNYIVLKHLNENSKLYIHKDKIKQINDYQLKQMKNLLFSF